MQRYMWLHGSADEKLLSSFILTSWEDSLYSVCVAEQEELFWLHFCVFIICL